ncbi:hypothetical protein AAU61_12455 [Desulfocarbo indianensis]|nr:hypothetical protein AAU61_12455 [Desulfocarbo indianensis]
MKAGSLEKLWLWLEARAGLLSKGGDESAGWRLLAFNGVFLCLVVLGGLSYLPTMVSSIQRGMWAAVLLYSLLYFFLMAVLLARRLTFPKRAALGIAAVYLIGLYTLEVAGLAGSGRVWLFCFSLLACLFLGLSWGLAALGLNILTLAAFTVWGEAWRPDWDALYLKASHREAWLVTSGTLTLVNAVAVVSLAFIVRGLEASLGSARKLQRRLEAKRLRLEEANQALGHEIQERRRAQARLTAALKERERMLNDMHRRVNDHMQVVSSLLSISRAKIADTQAREAVQESQYRLRAMGLIHESMYRSGSLLEVSLAEYIKELTSNLFQVYDLESRQIKLQVKAEGVFLGLDQAVPCGLILNELVINSIKHAFTLGVGGSLVIAAEKDAEGCLTLGVCDDGIGLPPGFEAGQGAGMGLYLARGLAENQLGGSFRLESGPGLRVSVRFPLQDAEKQGLYHPEITSQKSESAN